MLRRFLTRQPDHPPLCILALSARYGVIPAETKIADYNDRLTTPDATWLEERVRTPLSAVLSTPRTSICVFGGKTYRQALDGVPWPAPHTPVIFTAGGIGTQLSHLKGWLYHTR